LISGVDEDLESPPCVHVLVSLRSLVEGDFSVEHPAGIDLAGEDAGQNRGFARR
jgi:hypothetical protein